MNNNNKKPFNLSSKNKSEPETRVFARLISKQEIEKVSGGETCTGSKPLNGKPRIDCVYDS